MPLAQYTPGFPTIEIQGDWTDSDEILSDVASMWGMEFRTDLTYYIIVWEGPTDPDDWAAYLITTGDTLTIATGFDSTPAAGTIVYVPDMWFV
jgi:hypothetical protein